MNNVKWHPRTFFQVYSPAAGDGKCVLGPESHQFEDSGRKNYGPENNGPKNYGPKKYPGSPRTTQSWP